MFNETQNFSLVQTEVDEVFRQALTPSPVPNAATAQTAEIFKPTTVSAAAYIGTVHKGPGFFSQIGEVQTVPSTTMSVGNKFTVLIKAFAEGIDLSKDLFDDDQHGEWMAQVQEFAVMARRTQDFYAFKVFRLAFSTQLTADGVALCSTAHVLRGGGTTSNRLTSAVLGAATTQLTTSAINAAQKMLVEMKSHAGAPLMCMGNVLIVPPALFITARQVTASALVAENGNNAMNVLATDYGMKVYQSPYLGTASPDGLGSDTAWFLLDSTKHQVRRFVRQDIVTALRPWQYSNNRTYNFQANYREEVYVPDYIGLVGASGDAT